MATVQQFIATVKSHLGALYILGGIGPNGYDCSGLLYASALELGVNIPRTSEAQYSTLPHTTSPVPGCCIAFDVPTDNQPQPAHCGLYLSPSLMIDAPYTGTVVRYDAFPPPTVLGYYYIPELSLAQPPTPPSQVPSYKGTNMIARNSTGSGYWCVRPTGAVYAFQGAPDLGPTPALLSQWGIGTFSNPVVGISDDGAGGYMLEVDANQYPGQPYLYHIDSSGQYAK